MALYFIGAIFRHHSDDQSADHRHDNHPRTNLRMFGAAEMKGPIVVKRDIGEKADQIVKNVRDEARKTSDRRSKQRYQSHPITGNRRRLAKPSHSSNRIAHLRPN